MNAPADLKIMKKVRQALTFRPLDKKRWEDFESLLGERGGCGGCWCMAWRLCRTDFENGKGRTNKASMRRLVNSGRQLGIIGYDGEKPVAWCSVAPREEFVRLEKARVLKRTDDQPVWSVTCFFILKEYRRKGYSVDILKNVISHAREKKAKILEAYPIIPYSDQMPAPFAWTGIISSFEKAGFSVAKKWSKSRPILRFYL